MIKSFKHKGLEKFYRTGSTAGIQATHAKRLRLILLTLIKQKSPMTWTFQDCAYMNSQVQEKALGRSLSMVISALRSDSTDVMRKLLTTRIITNDYA